MSIGFSNIIIEKMQLMSSGYCKWKIFIPTLVFNVLKRFFHLPVGEIDVFGTEIPFPLLMCLFIFVDDHILQYIINLYIIMPYALLLLNCSIVKWLIPKQSVTGREGILMCLAAGNHSKKKSSRYTTRSRISDPTVIVFFLGPSHMWPSSIISCP